MKRLWRDYNLSVVLGLLFFGSWIGQLITQWFNWANEQQDHASAATRGVEARRRLKVGASLRVVGALPSDGQ